jgi:hypothetical protein
MHQSAGDPIADIPAIRACTDLSGADTDADSLIRYFYSRLLIPS